MRYLKVFNEGKEDLQNIAELCFVELIDQNFNVDTKPNSISISYFSISTPFRYDPVKVSFHYNTIKKYVDTCHHFLRKKYSTINFKIQDSNGNILDTRYEENYPENDFKRRISIVKGRQKVVTKVPPNNKSYYCNKEQLFKHISHYSLVTFEISCYGEVFKNFNETYLKKFESLEEDVEGEFREFCRTYLANLLDDHDYDFSIRQANSSTRGLIYIFLLFHDYSIFEWNKVKDHIIPFLHLFRKRYNILDLPYYQMSKLSDSMYRYIDEEPINRTIRFQTDRDKYYYTNIDYVINDKDVPEEFYQIQIMFN